MTKLNNSNTIHNSNTINTTASAIMDDYAAAIICTMSKAGAIEQFEHYNMRAIQSPLFTTTYTDGKYQFIFDKTIDTFAFTVVH